MRARPGDRLVVDGNRVGAPPRFGEVVDVLRGRGDEHYRVRWESGEESIFFPQGDCRMIDPDPEPSVTDPGTGLGAPQIDLRPGAAGAARAAESGEIGRRHGFEMWLAEDDSHTEARVTVQLREVEMTGFGVARRNPHDPQVPMVGEELAMARALQDLSQQLFRLASHQIERREGHPIDLPN
jgi:hypothetical protein